MLTLNGSANPWIVVPSPAPTSQSDWGVPGISFSHTIGLAHDAGSEESLDDALDPADALGDAGVGVAEADADGVGVADADADGDADAAGVSAIRDPARTIAAATATTFRCLPRPRTRPRPNSALRAGLRGRPLRITLSPPLSVRSPPSERISFWNPSPSPLTARHMVTSVLDAEQPNSDCTMRWLCSLSPGLSRACERISAACLNEDSFLFRIYFTRLRAPPPASGVVRQALAASADPADPPRWHARDKREIGHIASNDRAGRDQRPAPDHAARDDYCACPNRCALAHDDATRVPVRGSLELPGHIYRSRINFI